MVDDKQLERVNYKINNRLELHGKIKTYNKNIKVVRQNITDFRNKSPLLRRYGIRNDLKNNVMDAMSKSEDSATQGIMLTSKGIGTAKATVRTGVSAIKMPYRVGKTAYRITKFTIRTGKRLPVKKYALNSPPKESLFARQRERNRRTLKKKKPGLLSQAKGAGNHLLQVQKEDIKNTGVASIQQALDVRRQIRPYVNTAKKATKFTYNNVVKKPVVAIARKNQYNALQALRTKQRELKYGKSGLNKTSQLGKIKTARPRRRIRMARRNLGYKQAEKRGIKITAKATIRASKAMARVLTNPLTLKAGAIVAVVYLFISTSTTLFGAIIPSASTTVMADENVVLKYSERLKALNEDFVDEIDKLKKSSRYDDYKIYYSDEEEHMEGNLVDVLAISAVLHEQNLVFSEHEQAVLGHLFNEILSYRTRTRTYYCLGCETGGKEEDRTCPGHTRINIYIDYCDMEEVMTAIGFKEEEKEWARLISSSDLAGVFPNVSGL